jgi:DNA-binding MarR family transcriptional regulator
LSDESAPSEADFLNAFDWFTAINEIGIINQLTSTEFSRILPHDLTIAQFTVLNHCVRLGDNRTPAELASAFQITRGTLTSTLKRLEQKSFIEVIADAQDGRSKRVLLTDAGRKAREDSIAAAIPLLLELGAQFPKDLVSQLLPQLQQVREYLDQRRD